MQSFNPNEEPESVNKDTSELRTLIKAGLVGVRTGNIRLFSEVIHEMKDRRRK